MRRILRTSLAMLLALGLSTGVATAATTTEQLVALAQAGLDDDILIALIQTDGSTFQLSAADILELHRQGLSNRVIRAMQETAPKPLPVIRTQEPVWAPGQFESTHVQAVPPPAAAGVTVTQIVTQRVEAPVQHAVPVFVPVFVHAPVGRRPAKPVYWGWGGQRRPDSWDDGVRKDK